MSALRWTPTGWHASDAGGYVIELSLFLPLDVRPCVRRHGASWKYRTDLQWHPAGWSRRFKTRGAAMRACEKKVAAELKAALAKLRRMKR